ncbi:Rv0909 family putative TA system antitoxin [Stackebrandtia nassauensis]|uniref:CsbD family protein n=1 Tax=Stackebrandtia nassauensis (strain DSM 44728 / CIP 108903 / NRRL B-16338 / NBRC 102104 / LLR-40K-21) TaxID=446470 RepID=D3PYP5_STANL|nr:Rv0909 family putative TA system antitoxin [Stackebrandtia nassauensis]ADD43478.1 conserved hypothetical protein [Stackebrandtia nassauensis DSM 44728]
MGIQDKLEGAKDKAMGKVEEMKGKAKGKAAEKEGEAKGKAAETRGQADAADSRNSGMVDKTADFINQKTDGKYEDKIDTAVDKVKKMTGQQ